MNRNDYSKYVVCVSTSSLKVVHFFPSSSLKFSFSEPSVRVTLFAEADREKEKEKKKNGSVCFSYFLFRQNKRTSSINGVRRGGMIR